MMLGIKDKTPIRAEFFLEVLNNPAGPREPIVEGIEIIPVISIKLRCSQFRCEMPQYEPDGPFGFFLWKS